MHPKYGFLSIITQAFYNKQIEECTMIPVTINYTRTLEGETFPFELTGEEKVKESLGRIIRAVRILSMNLGSIYLDFCDPIPMDEFTLREQKAIGPQFDPYKNQKDRLTITKNLAYRIVYTLQNNIRIMPTTLVASVLLLHRKGINEQDMEKKVIWLGQTLSQRGILMHSQGMPSANTMKIGLQHLSEYLDQKRDIFEPSVTPKIDYKNYLMLGYYRNPINFIFFNEGLIVTALFSQGQEVAWKDGVSYEELFKRTAWIAEKINEEIVLEQYITRKNEAEFKRALGLMKERKLVSERENGVFVLNEKNESGVLFSASIMWPIIDSFYIVLVYCLSLVKGDGVDMASLSKRIQWLAESMYEDRMILYFESCNQESIKSALSTFQKQGILQQKNQIFTLTPKFRSEEAVTGLIEQISEYRNAPRLSMAEGIPYKSLRRTMMSEFPFLAKL